MKFIILNSRNRVLHEFDAATRPEANGVLRNYVRDNKLECQLAQVLRRVTPTIVVDSSGSTEVDL